MDSGELLKGSSCGHGPQGNGRAPGRGVKQFFKSKTWELIKSTSELQENQKWLKNGSEVFWPFELPLGQ